MDYEYRSSIIFYHWICNCFQYIPFDKLVIMFYLNNFENNFMESLFFRFIILTIIIIKIFLSIFLLFLEIEEVREIDPNKIIIY